MLSNRGGFTLFEVMITMAVSGAMLVTAVILFGGQQRKVQFAQSTRDLKTTIQDIMNDTSTGYFPNSSFSCTSSATGPVIDINAGVEQGSNQSCIFLGKAIHFKNDQMDVYPIAGNRGDASSPTATFQSSFPTVIPELVTTKVYQAQLELYEIWWGDIVTSHLDAGNLIVFGSTPNGTGTAGAGDFFNSGVQKINAYSSGTIPATVVSGTDGVATINTAMQNAAFSWPPNNEVTLCVEDAPSGEGGRQVAGIVISGGANGITVRSQLDTDTVVCS